MCDCFHALPDASVGGKVHMRLLVVSNHNRCPCSSSVGQDPQWPLMVGGRTSHVINNPFAIMLMRSSVVLVCKI